MTPRITKQDLNAIRNPIQLLTSLISSPHRRIAMGKILLMQLNTFPTTTIWLVADGFLLLNSRFLSISWRLDTDFPTTKKSQLFNLIHTCSITNTSSQFSR